MSSDLESVLIDAQVHCDIVSRKIEAQLELERSRVYFSDKDKLFNIKGKMLRPSLSFYSAQAFSGVSLINQPVPSWYDELVSFGVAVELLHNASLVHDDVLDEEMVRRNMPTLNALFGNKTALLTGNILYLLAFRFASAHLSPATLLSIINAAMTMCYGEIRQLDLKSDFDEEAYRYIISSKTGRLTAIACGESVRIAGGSLEDIGTYEKLGLHIGILYQLLDDMKDRDSMGNAERYISEMYPESLRIVREIVDAIGNNPGKKSFEKILGLFDSAYVLV